MASMLENPNFASTLSEALSNPEVIDQMIRQNPMLRDMGPQVRQMMQDPGFRRMMTDPEALRNLSQMQRQFGGGMFGGARGGNQAFPAPGVTDTTPSEPSIGGDTATPNQADNTPQPPANPFAMFGNPGAAGGAAAGAGAGGNPFAALFGTGGMGGIGSTASPTSPPAAGTPAPGASSETPANPFASMAQSMMQNPQLMQQMMASMGGMGGMGGNATANPGGPNTNPAQGFNPFAALQAMQGAGGFGGYGTPSPAPQDDRPPEDRYAEQLRQLNDMGFYEFERNVEALRRTGGSVQGAVEYLLTH